MRLRVVKKMQSPRGLKQEVWLQGQMMGDHHFLLHGATRASLWTAGGALRGGFNRGVGHYRVVSSPHFTLKSPYCKKTWMFLINIVGIEVRDDRWDQSSQFFFAKLKAGLFVCVNQLTGRKHGPALLLSNAAANYDRYIQTGERVLVETPKIQVWTYNWA